MAYLYTLQNGETENALMRENSIKQAFSFDEHFSTAGFTLIPSRA